MRAVLLTIREVIYCLNSLVPEVQLAETCWWVCPEFQDSELMPLFLLLSRFVPEQGDQAKNWTDCKRHKNKLHIHILYQEICELNTDNCDRESNAVRDRQRRPSCFLSRILRDQG